jgi:starch synthase
MTPKTNRSEAETQVIMFAAEAAPFAKVGGLGDVIGALPKALAKHGVKTTIIIPGYREIHSQPFNIEPCREIPVLDVRMGDAIEQAEIFHARMDEAGVDIYFIGSKKYFDREGIYDDPATREGYPDNMQRFIFFMKSGIDLIARMGKPVDVIHCHDSHTALIPGLIHANYRDNPFFSRAGTLFTIHNLAHQGIYSKDSLDCAGIDSRYYYPTSPFEYWGQVNFMKAGIQLADKVNTVSQRYSIEIQTDHEYGMGLEGVLQERKRDLSGIVNGIDYEEWNPENDALIPAHFSARDLSGKALCKEHLLKSLDLSCSRKRIPLIGIVSRLVDQKGVDLIAEAAEDLAALNLQLIILGMGQKKYHDFFGQLAARHPEKIAVRLVFDNELAHKIEAGCDLFLMPSKFEPCGLNQLYSLRYGTIPVVRTTGGLADTVLPYGAGNGTGFCFSEYSSVEMMAAIKQAMAVYSDRPRWKELMIRAMSQDWSWDRSAREYLQLYRNIYDMHKKV